MALVKLCSVSPYTVSAAKPLEGDLPRETAYQLPHTPEQLHAGGVEFRPREREAYNVLHYQWMN